MATARWLLPVAGAADQHGVALVGQEAADRQLADQRLVDRGVGEVEVGQLLGQRQLGATHLVLDGSRLLVGDLGLQQLADDSLHRMLALEAVGEHLVERVAHAGELECGHHLQDLMALHGRPPLKRS